MALLITIVLFVTALRARLRVALVATLASFLLVPSALVVPASPTSILTVQRTTAVALLMNLLLLVRRREISGRVFAITPVHAVFVAMLAVSFVVGVAYAQPTVSVTDSSHIWANYFGEFVIFLIVLAAIRAIGDTMFVARALAVLLLVTAGIAFVEHFTGGSWARLLYRRSGQIHAGAANQLQMRGGQTRVRVASDFSLDYAWIASSLVPLFLVVCLSRLRRWWYVGAGMFIVLLAIYWTRSRSMAAALVVTLIALAVFGRSRRAAIYSLTTLAVMAAAYVSSSSISRTLSAAADIGSIHVRFARVPSIASFVAPHALGGLGFTGVSDLGFQAVDSTYILLYGDIGVIGLTMFALLYITGVAVAARTVYIQQPRERLIGVAAALGVLTLVGAGFAYDSSTQLNDQYMLWTFAALAMVTAERTIGAPRWLAVPSFGRVVAVAAAAAVGFFIYVAAPTHVATTFTFSTLAPSTQLADNPPNTGSTLIRTVCNVAAADQFEQGGVRMTCQDPNSGLAPLALQQGVSLAGPGQGSLRIQARDEASGRAALRKLTQTLHQVRQLRSVRIQPVTATQSGRSTVWRTAPVWLPLIVGVALIMLPRRRPRAQPTYRPAFSW
jgi:hypothetical protein